MSKYKMIKAFGRALAKSNSDNNTADMVLKVAHEQPDKYIGKFVDGMVETHGGLKRTDDLQAELDRAFARHTKGMSQDAIDNIIGTLKFNKDAAAPDALKARAADAREYDDRLREKMSDLLQDRSRSLEDLLEYFNDLIH